MKNAKQMIWTVLFTWIVAGLFLFNTLLPAAATMRSGQYGRAEMVDGRDYDSHSSHRRKKHRKRGLASKKSKKKKHGKHGRGSKRHGKKKKSRKHSRRNNGY